MRDLLQRLSAPPMQILRILQPTPFTVSYTVSTRAAPRTIFAKATSYVGVLIRITVGLLAVFVLWAKYRAGGRTQYYLAVLLGSQWAHQLLIAETCQWKYVAPSALTVLFLVLRRNYTEESITLLRGLGVQISTTSSTFLQTPTTRFIPTTNIQDIFIHEAFKGFEVRFYLAIVVEGEQDVVVVFPSLLPKRVILEEVWRGTRKCLWAGKDEQNDLRAVENTSKCN
ncbi:GPI-GlcNAc transferase complex, PIG-H component-domain-containing protein [Phaeosphaeriaceae sp. PMI808]|nr:GPI-GlcNAc transferase complex, PIG-H component-domain-containing protein [Phaeosphaeriaceae sp. PMI808]